MNNHILNSSSKPRAVKPVWPANQRGGGQSSGTGEKEPRIVVGAATALRAHHRIGMSNAKLPRTNTDLLTFAPASASIVFTRAPGGAISHPLANEGYDPNEPRVPAGQRGGGQWTSGASGYGAWQLKIRATIFGGKYDPNISAITNKPIPDNQLGAALPGTKDKLKGKHVEIKYKDKSVIVPIVDIGPYYDGTPTRPADPYWETNSRPKAETEHPYPKGNGSGIDMTPATLTALGIPYAPHYNKKTHKMEWVTLGDDPIVDWRFVPAPKK